MKLTHKSAWYSPRGFCNEGTYIYGTIDAINNFFRENVAGDVNSDWDCIHKHYNVDTARKHCEKLAKKDKLRHKYNNEISSICVEKIV